MASGARFTYMITRRLQSQMCTEVQNMLSSKAGSRPASVAAEIKGVIFDMDGTLTVPVLDFGKLRRILGLSPREDILDAVSKMEEAQKAHAKKLIEEFEAEGRQQFQLQSDIVQLLELIVSCDVKLALVTRNSQESVDFFMGRLEKEIDEASDFLHWPIFSEVIAYTIHICLYMVHMCCAYTMRTLSVERPFVVRWGMSSHGFVVEGSTCFE